MNSIQRSIAILISLAVFLCPAALADTWSDLKAVSQAPSLIYCEGGDSNQPTQLWLCFNRLYRANSLNAGTLKGKLNSATPAGKIYLLLLLRQTDPTEGSHLMEKLLKNKEKVLYKKGCMLETMTVEKLCRHLAAGQELVKLR